MGRTIHKLTATAVAKIKEPGMHGDGGGLYLRIAPGGARGWIFRFKRRDMGLGSFPAVSLAEARQKAAQARKRVEAGEDPIAARRTENAPAKAATFAEIAADYIEAHRSKWTNEKSLQRWQRFERYAVTAFGNKHVAAVDTADVLALLKPLWTSKPESAAKLREWLEGALDFARVKGHRQGENPARWRGHLNHMLPARNRAATVKHFAALPYAELPDFMVDLASRDALAARAVELTILCATRTSETLEADRSEIEADLWTIPAHRHKTGKKTGKPHRVPLSPQAAAIIDALPMLSGSPYLFPGLRPGRPLSGMAMEMLLRRMGRGDAATVHGFRSTFRDWAAEQTSFPREIAELCLAHDVGDAVERSYRRSDLLAKRRALLQEWANFACAKTSR